MTPSKILFYLCVSFVLGIFLKSIVASCLPAGRQIFIWGILVLAILIIITSFFTKKDNFIIAGFCILFLLLGILRFQISEFNIANDNLSKFNDKAEPVVLTGVILSEPDVRDTSQKLKVNVQGSTVLVTTGRYPEYKYLDKIKITGKLKTPAVNDDFNYKNYLMKDGIYSVMDFPKISALGGESPNFLQRIYSSILFFKQKLRESIRKNFLPPQSLILEGTILGDNGVMTNDLKNKLNITGLRHIISVSGTHVVILSEIIMVLLISAGLFRGQAFYIAIILICIYIPLTGLPASGIRAGIMGGLFLLSQKLGRQNVGARTIVIACAVMLLINPLLLFYDVGFQLSFLAVLGLIYAEPLICDFIKIFTKNKAKSFVKIVSTTFAAQIFTLPIMIFNFGNISFVSPITNLLISPVVYWLMIFGFLSSMAGIISNFLSFIFFVPCWFLLEYFLKIIDLFSAPWAIKNIQNVSWVWLAVSYFFIAVITAFLKKKQKEKFLEY